MKEEVPQNSEQCPMADISAYIDGELSSADELAVELHLAGCRVCAEELNFQKSFLHALNSSLESEDEIELPANFTRTVVTNAESRVSGLRGPRERLNAVFICSALFLFALFALGSDAERTFASIGTVLEKLMAVAAAAAHFVYDISLGTAIIFRTLSSKFVFDSGFTLVVVVFGVLIFLFSRLILRHGRV